MPAVTIASGSLGGSGAGIALGNALDALPEAMVLGIALRDPGVPIGLVIAFSVGNLLVLVVDATTR